MIDFAANIRRLMAREGLTINGLAQRSEIDPRTLKGLLGGDIQPQPRTLHKLAAGLGVTADDLFHDAPRLATSFDRQTNPEVAAAIAANPRLFSGWSDGEFDELYSRFGHGGALSPEGAVVAATAMNRRRDLIRKVTLILETGDAELLAQFIELLHKRNLVRPQA